MVRAVSRNRPVAGDGPFHLRDRAGVIKASLPRQRGVEPQARSVPVRAAPVRPAPVRAGQDYRRSVRRLATLAWTAVALLVGMWLGSGLQSAQQVQQTPAVNASGGPPAAVAPITPPDSASPAPEPRTTEAPSEPPAAQPPSVESPPTEPPPTEPPPVEQSAAEAPASEPAAVDTRFEPSTDEEAAVDATPVGRETTRAELLPEADSASIGGRIDRGEPAEHMRDLHRQVRDAVEPVLVGLFDAARR